MHSEQPAAITAINALAQKLATAERLVVAGDARIAELERVTLYVEALELLDEVSRDLIQAKAEVKQLRKEREGMVVTARLSGLCVIFSPLAERGTVIMHPDDMPKGAGK